MKKKKVILIPDNDAPGWKRVINIAQKLEGKATSVHIADVRKVWPKEADAIHKGADVTDAIESGATAKRVKRWLENAPEFNPDEFDIPEFDEYEEDVEEKEDTDNPHLGTWAEVMKEIRGIEWLVDGWIPMGLLTGIIAEPTIGKSAFALGGLVTPIITGGSFFTGQSAGEPGNVMYCDTECAIGQNVERMKDWGLADYAHRIYKPFAGDEPLNIESDEHIGKVRNRVEKNNIRLVVVDSFRGSFGGDENNSMISTGLKKLGMIAVSTGCAMVIIHHTKKLQFGEDLTYNSGRGSNAFLAYVRVQLGMSRPDPQGDWRRVQMLGENLGVAPEPIGFKITDTGLEFGKAPEVPKGGGGTEKDRAIEFLRERMQPGEKYASSELLESAKEEEGLAPASLYRAAKELRIIKRKDGTTWNWELVEPIDVSGLEDFTNGSVEK